MRRLTSQNAILQLPNILFICLELEKRSNILQYTYYFPPCSLILCFAHPCPFKLTHAVLLCAFSFIAFRGKSVYLHFPPTSSPWKAADFCQCLNSSLSFQPGDVDVGVTKTIHVNRVATARKAKSLWVDNTIEAKGHTIWCQKAVNPDCCLNNL